VTTIQPGYGDLTFVLDVETAIVGDPDAPDDSGAGFAQTCAFVGDPAGTSHSTPWSSVTKTHPG
jgi:hypothetical protein